MRALLPLPLACAVLLGAATAARAATLGIVTPGPASEPAARAAQAARSAAEENGWTVEQRDASVDGDALAQLVRRGVEGLVLVTVRPEVDPTGLQAARAAGVPIVTVLAGASAGAGFDLTVNQYAVGADLGAYLLAHVGYQGRLVLLRADDAESGARARARVLELMLEQAPSLRLLATVERPAGAAAGWEAAFRAELDAVLAAAGPPAPLAVWSATDAVALLAEEVLRARGYGREQVVLVGAGGSQAAFARLRDPAGLLTATAAIPYELLGEAAVDVLDDIRAGTPPGQIAVGPYVFVDAVLVDRGSVPADDELPW